MGHYVRAFCTTTKIPNPGPIQTWLRKHKSKAVLDEPNHALERVEKGKIPKPALDLKSKDWVQIAVSYQPGKLPILAECNSSKTSEGKALMQEEIAEFVEFIGKPGRSAGKARALAHLAKTKFIIACQLPTSDMEEDGYQANWEFVCYFREYCDGMIQVDGEGFYDEKNKLIVRLD
jgi:hypothetical protein